MKLMSRAIVATALVSIAVLTGCDDFERQTYKTLAASKAVVDQAHKDYVSGAIPRTTCSKGLIEEAVEIDSTAVELMTGYETAKATKVNTADAQTAVAAELLKLPDVLVRVKSLYTSNPNCR